MSTVQQLAKELGMTSQEVLSRLAAMGRPAESHLSSVDQGVVDRLRREGGNGRSGAGASPPPPATVDDPGRAEPTAPVAASDRSSASTTDVEASSAEQAARRDGDGAPPDEPKKAGTKPPSGRGRKVVNQILELPLLVLVAFGIAVVIKLFLVQAFFIPSGSMSPTLKVGDRVLVEKIGYRFGEPDRGQVVVFERFIGGQRAPDLPWTQDARNFFRELLGLPTGSQQDYIKRIVAVGGDVISYQGKPRQLVVNSREVDEPYLGRRVDRTSGTITRDSCRSMRLRRVEDGCRVPAGTVFVMGDNRNNSQDSRFFGPVVTDQIVGRAFVVIWPPRDFGGL